VHDSDAVVARVERFSDSALEVVARFLGEHTVQVDLRVVAEHTAH
jgi:hypothetical protein